MRSCMRAPPSPLARCLTVTGSVLLLMKPGTPPPCGRGAALQSVQRHQRGAATTAALARAQAHALAHARSDRIGTSRAPGAAHLSQVWHLAMTHRLGRLRQRRYSVLRPGRNHSLLALVSGAYEDRQLVRPPRTAACLFPGPAAPPRPQHPELQCTCAGRPAPRLRDRSTGARLRTARPPRVQRRAARTGWQLTPRARARRAVLLHAVQGGCAAPARQRGRHARLRVRGRGRALGGRAAGGRPRPARAGARRPPRSAALWQCGASGAGAGPDLPDLHAAAPARLLSPRQPAWCLHEVGPRLTHQDPLQGFRRRLPLCVSSHWRRQEPR